MEHCVHLVAGHFIDRVSPTSQRRVLAKVKRAFKKAGVADDALESVDLNILNAELAGLDDDGDSADEEDEDEEDEGEFTAGDAVGKALALVNQVMLFVSYLTM